MATVVDPQVDLEEFHAWLGKELARGKPGFTLSESVDAFLAYRQLRDRIKEGLRPYEERKRRGEDASFPWNLEEAMAELDRRLATKGIVDESGPR